MDQFHDCLTLCYSEISYNFNSRNIHSSRWSGLQLHKRLKVRERNNLCLHWNNKTVQWSSELLFFFFLIMLPPFHKRHCQKAGAIADFRKTNVPRHREKSDLLLYWVNKGEDANTTCVCSTSLARGPSQFSFLAFL